MAGTVESISQIVEIVGGQFGQVSLEQKFDIVEKALFRCREKPDESADSYLARSEVAWTELLVKKMYTSGKRDKSLKTYDHLAFGVEELDDHADEGTWDMDERPHGHRAGRPRARHLLCQLPRCSEKAP